MDAKPVGEMLATSEPELEVDRRILRARAAAKDALEQRNWDAAVLACGKVLQEVARSELPYNEHGGTLPQLLERLARRLQTDQPVSDLAAALKDAGGLRGFFDLERDVDEELARATLRVVESFLTYTYAFRAEVRRLADLASRRRAADSSSPTPELAPPQAEPDAAERPRDTASGGERARDERLADARTERAQRSHSVFDRFEDRPEDPIRQTWRPPRKDE